MAARDFFVEVAGIFGRWLKKTFRRPSFVFFALVQPIVWFVLFTQSFARIADLPAFAQYSKGASYLTFFTGAVIIQTVMASAMQSGIGMVNDIESGYMDKMRVAPIHRASILLGKVMSDGVRILLQSIVIIVLGLILGVTFATGVLGILALLLLAVAFGIAWSGISTLIALATRNAESTLMISILTTFPLLFLSTAVMPKTALPELVQNIVPYNPISYVAEAMHGLILSGFDYWTLLGQAFLVILVVGAITLTGTTAMFRKAVAA
ncbi:MAG: ABC transporter permease [Methanobacteriota archaeon]|nr:MAG: ABC transporter permease [Euryarchaeota archaeon]